MFVCTQMEVLLRQKQAERDKQLKRQETDLRREAEIQLDIQRQKNRELQNKYQSENQQLQNKVQTSRVFITGQKLRFPSEVANFINAMLIKLKSW